MLRRAENINTQQHVQSLAADPRVHARMLAAGASLLALALRRSGYVRKTFPHL